MNYKTYEVRIYSNGTKYWYLNGKLHREDGPAIEHFNGSKHWFLNGGRHREDGPACEYSDGSKYWFLNDKYFSESEYLEKMSKKNNSCEGKIVEIDGKKYKLSSI